MNLSIEYVRTADGDLAARVAHLVIGLIPMKDGSMRTLTAWPARDPATCSRSDFHASGFASSDEAGFRRDVEEFAEHERQKTALGRSDIDRTMLRSMHTPWGTPDHGALYAEGVASVSTPGHGGFVLNAERNAQVHEAWRAGRESDNAFYEEDQMWAVVAHTFPDLFTDRERAQARRTLVQSMPDEWERATGETLLTGMSHERDRRDFMHAHRDAEIAGSACRSKTDPTKVLVNACVGGRDGRGRWIGRQTLYLIDATEYERRSASNPFRIAIMDPATDQAVDEREAPIGTRIAA